MIRIEWSSRSGWRAAAGGFAAAAMVALAGCSHLHYGWTRQDTTADQQKQDQRECAAEAGGYGFLLGSPQGAPHMQPGSSSSPSSTDLYRSCMVQRGYSMAPIKPKSAGEGQAAAPPAGQ